MARFSESERTLIWDRWQQGESMRGVARELVRVHAWVRTMIESYGGVRPVLDGRPASGAFSPRSESEQTASTTAHSVTVTEVNQKQVSALVAVPVQLA